MPPKKTIAQTTLALAVGESPSAKALAKKLQKTNDFAPLNKAEILIAVGGDGFMLKQIRKMATLKKQIPIYGINAGSVGFLLNHYHSTNLQKNIKKTVAVELHPLSVEAKSDKGRSVKSFAFNELSLFRHSQQAAHISIKIDGKTRLKNIICDGLLVATPAGSTAYNAACGGSILPMGADILALTPISVFRPRRWSGAILPNRAVINLTAEESKKRPIAAAVDGVSLGTITNVKISEDRTTSVQLLFDPGESLDERIFKEQFIS